MPRRNPPPSDDDHGWLITPRALTSVATVVGLIYTLYAPVRYVLQIGATVDALNARVAALEIERAPSGRGKAVVERAVLQMRPRVPAVTPPAAPAQTRRFDRWRHDRSRSPMTGRTFFLP